MTVKGLMHLNINSLPPKIDELRCIADSEILIDNYDLLHCDRNRNSAGVACYIRNDLSYTQKNLFPNDIENIFFGIHLPKTKPITVGIVCRPPDLTYFINTFTANFAKLDTTNTQNILDISVFEE